MKITNVETILLTGPCTNDPYLSEARKRRSAAFVRISTNTEIIGLGETYAGYFIPEIIPEIVSFFSPILIGKDPENIALLFSEMYHCGNFWCRTGVGLQVLSALEAALWDIRGKVEKEPVWKLLCKGEAKKKLPCYATGGPANYPLEKLAKKIDHYIACGFSAFKVSAGEFRDNEFITSADPEKAAEIEYQKLLFLTGHYGSSFSFMLDGHMGNWRDMHTVWKLDTARAVMKALSDFDLVFFEEPLHYNDRESYHLLAAESQIPIAGGEALSGMVEWEPYIEKDCFAIGQPDAAYVGGFLQFMEIADALAKKGKKIATHSWAAGGGFMQNIHAGFAASNTSILEIAPNYGPLHSEIIGDSFQLKEGFVLPPEKPGLGIELTQKTIDRFPFVRGSGEFNSVPGKILTD